MEGRTDGRTDEQTDRIDENYIPFQHTLYAWGIISARSRAAEYTTGFCLETAKNLERSKCMEMAGFRHVRSFQSLVRLSLLTMTNPNQLCDVFFYYHYLCVLRWLIYVLAVNVCC